MVIPKKAGREEMKVRLSTKPWSHQIAGLKYLMPRQYGALFTDMGSGKTKIMIDLIVNRAFTTTLVLAPKKVCDEWPKQIQKHAFKTPINVIDVSNIEGSKKSTKVRESVAETELGQTVIVCNYDSVWREPFKSFLLKMKIDCVICDEMHRIKSPGSKVSRFLALIGKRVENRFGMTGTPLGQSPLDIYAQYRFLEPSIFGTNFGKFEDEYANMIPSGAGFSFLNKSNPFKNLDKLKEKMFSCAFSVDVDLGLPETQDISVEFHISPTSERYYKELQKEGCLELTQGTVQAGNVLTVMTRLQQITSGYLPLEDEDGKVTVRDIDTARREALRELLQDIPSHEPIVVFAKYTKDIKNIRKIVKEIGSKSSELSGQRNTKHNWVDGKSQVLVVQISSGAEGLNDLVKSKYCIYYSLHHSLTLWKQSRKRQHRPGQTRPVVYYTLIAKMRKGKTIDEKILDSLKNNQEIIASIMEDREI